jgi:hypothetical protein
MVASVPLLPALATVAAPPETSSRRPGEIV